MEKPTCATCPYYDADVCQLEPVVVSKKPGERCSHHPDFKLWLWQSDLDRKDALRLDASQQWREEAEREEKARLRIASTDILRQAGVKFESRNYGTILLLRERGKPAVDLYPGTQRWRVKDCEETFSGDIREFLAWYGIH
jgi:hypothetical protein